MEHEILLDVRHLTHIFPLSRKTAVKAVDDVSFQIRRGEIFGLVGESGSGKSTAARCVMNIYQPFIIKGLIPATEASSGKIKKCCRRHAR